MKKPIKRIIKNKKAIALNFFDFQGKELDINLIKDKSSCYRITVWGPDDIGYEFLGNLDKCLLIFNNLKERILLSNLIELGFVQA